MADRIAITSNALEVMARFNLLPTKVQTRVIGPSLRASGKPLVAAARTKLPVRSKSTKKVGVISETTGALRQSLGVKLVKRKRKSSRVLVIGPRVGEQFTRTDSEGRVRKPWKYGHIVERMVGKSFMRTAVDTAAPAAIAAFAVRLKTGMDKEIAKLRAKSG